ncbi:MAG TPA: hypothetical protein VM008_05080 [Phycisphaerae bacterium]|nr:hypothetical protein [Phycisphaerae bacterium]
MAEKVLAHVRNGKLGFWLNGEEIELILPDEYKNIAKESDDDDTDSDDEQPATPHPKTEAHCRLWWNESPELRRTFGVTIEAPGSDRYERRFKEFCRRALGGGHGDCSEAEEIAFERQCEADFAANTSDGQPRWKLFGVKNADPSSDDYKFGLRRYTNLERSSRAKNATLHGILPTTTIVVGGAGSNRVTGTTPPTPPTPAQLEAAMDNAEKAARERWASDRELRGRFGLLDRADPNGPEYQNAMQRYINLEKCWARDNWQNPVR